MLTPQEIWRRILTEPPSQDLDERVARQAAVMDGRAFFGPAAERQTRLVERQRQLAALAESWEPAASATPPARRLSKCAACARRMWFPWHFWLDAGAFKKELHICSRCVRKRGWST